MAKIPLTIDPEYCSSWGFWEGIRELIQNAKDAEDHDNHKMKVRHSTQAQTLTIINDDVSLPANLLLLLGATTKRGSGQRGKFGEGFAIGVLALVRAGHEVTIYNGDEVWRPEIATPDEGHPFEGSRLLVFNTRKLQNVRSEFEVVVNNVSKEVWEVTKKLFLFLQPPKATEVVETWSGKVLLGDEYKGMIFSRGIFVTKNEDVECGYDINNLELDRDRRTVDEWHLKYKLGDIWNDAQAKEPAKFAPRIYQMAKDEKAEIKGLHYHADKKLVDHLRQQFEEEHGEGTVAVESMQDAKELEQLGARTAVVNKTLAELLRKSGPTLYEVKDNLKKKAKNVLTWNGLTADEIDVCNRWIERVTQQYLIVEFNDPSIGAQFLSEYNKIGVDRSVLARPPREVVLIVAKEEARRRTLPVENVLLDLIFTEPEVTANAAV